MGLVGSDDGLLSVGRTFVCGAEGFVRCDVGPAGIGKGLVSTGGESIGLNVEVLGGAGEEALHIGEVLTCGGSGDEVLLLSGV